MDEGHLFPRGSPSISVGDTNRLTASPLQSPFHGPVSGKLLSSSLRCMLIERLSQRDGGGSDDDDDANDGGDTAAHMPKP